MLRLVSAISLVVLVSCGQTRTVERKVYVDGSENAEPCSVEQFDDGARISCPDGSVSDIYHGQDGEAGQDGVAGKDGKDGKDGIDGKDGADGVDGQAGKDGKNGKNGKNGKDGNIAELEQPLYIGYYCSRVMIKIGDIYYIINHSLIPIYNKWVKISNNCKVRIYKGKVETK